VTSALDGRILARNDASRLRLEALVARLSDADLTRELECAWSVGVALAHLAFWDTLDVALLQRWRAGQRPSIEPDWYADAVNAAALPAWRLVPARDAARLALHAASAIDAAVASLDAWIIEALRARNEGWMVRRYLHRREHIAQIEEALACRMASSASPRSEVPC
jgi:hypothetical protein